MKKHPNRITQRAPRTLQERDLETIRGGLATTDSSLLLLQMQTQATSTQETIQAVNTAAKADYDTKQQIIQNMK
jgi:hypothetical protein